MKDAGGETTLSPHPHEEGVSYAKKKLKKRNIHHKPASKAADGLLIPAKFKANASSGSGGEEDHTTKIKEATLPAATGLSREERKVGNYQLMERIGKGGFGTVYRAIEINTGVTVAVKRVDLRNLSRAEVDDIEMEFKLLENLNHPNIVKYISNIRAFGFLHIILELMENGALTSLLAKLGGQPPEPLLAHYVEQVLAGLQYLHAQGVVHRDIKGGNILTDKDGHIKLTDFGIAKKLSENAGFEEAVGGTPYWMAPEIIEMTQQSSACDIWSLGCTIIELMTGSPPFHDCDPLAALYKIVTGEMPLPAGITPSLKDFLMECFQKDPNRRVTAAGLRKHPWLRKGLSSQDKNDSLKIGSSTLQTILAPPPKKSTTKITGDDDEDWDNLDDGYVTPKGENKAATVPERNDAILSSAIGEKRMARFEETGDEDYDDFADAQLTDTRLKAIHEEKVDKEEGDPFSELGDGQDIFDNLDFNDSGEAEGQAENEPGAVRSMAAVLDEMLADATVILEKITNTLNFVTSAAHPRATEIAESAPESTKLPPAVNNTTPTPAPVATAATTANADKPTPEAESGRAKRPIPPPPTHAPPLVQSLNNNVNQSFIKKISSKISEMSERIAADRTPHTTTTTTTSSSSSTTATSASTVAPAAAAVANSADSSPQPPSYAAVAAAHPPQLALNSSSTPSPSSSPVPSPKSAEDQKLRSHAFHFGLLCKQLTALIESAPQPDIKVELRKLSATPLVEALVKAPRLGPEYLTPILHTLNAILCTQEGVAAAMRELAIVPPTPSSAAVGPKTFDRQRSAGPGVVAKKLVEVDVKPKLAAVKGEKVPEAALVKREEPVAEVEELLDIDPETWSAVCILGLIPASIAYTSGEYALGVRTEAAQLAQYFCLSHHASFLSCGGLGAIRALLGTPFDSQSRSLVLVGLSCLIKVFQSPVPSRYFLARTLSDTLPYVASILLFCQNLRLQEPVLQCVDILGYFARADQNIKVKLISELVLRPLVNALPSLSGEALMGVLRVIHAVSIDPSALRLLEKLGCIKGLVTLLESVMEPPMSEKAKDTQKMLISILVVLCKINPTRLEQAAVAGVIPLMKRIIADQSPLKMFALPMLFNMGKLPHSRVCQAALRKAGGLELYISCLRDFYNRIDALEAIGAWSNNDPQFVEAQLLLPSTISQLCALFESVTAAVQFERVIRPYKQILNNSDKVCIALSEHREGKVIEVIKAKLAKHSNDSEIRVGLLHVLTLFYNKHPNTAEFVKRHDLIPLLSELREKDNSIIVAQLAGRLLARMRLLSVKMRVKSLAKAEKESLVNEPLEENIG